MIRTCALALFLATTLSMPLQAADDFDHYTSVGEIGLTITNFGVIGHGYNIEGQPSCLYKQYSGLDFEQVEHFSYAGVWVGGKVDNEARVSTAVMDGTFGGFGWEWNNIGEPADASGADPAYAIQTRSTFMDSPYFHPDAISHQDFLMSFTDTSTVVPGTDETIEDHNPLGLRIDLESHAWNYSYANGFVVIDLTLTNVSADMDGVGWTIDSLYTGYWIDEAVGNFNLHDYYSPGRGGWSWYDNMAGVVLTDSTTTALGDTISMAVGYDADGDNGYAENMVGCRFIGGWAPHVEDPRTLKGNANTWPWNTTFSQEFPDLLTPANDEERLAKMQQTPNLDLANFPYGTEDARSWMMLSTGGCFGHLEPGESLNSVFAIVCAPKVFLPEPPAENEKDSEWLQAIAQNLVASSNWAKIAWDGEDKNGNGQLDEGEDLDFDGVLDRYLLPMPPPGPHLAVVVGDKELTLLWDNSSEYFVDPILGEADFEGYRIYSSLRTPSAEGDRTLVGQFDLVNDIWPNSGLEDLRVANFPDLAEELEGVWSGEGHDSLEVDGRWFQYAFKMENLLTGRPSGNWLAVSAYDKGFAANNLPSLESDVKENWVFVFPGSLPDVAHDDQDFKPGVYPNPYRAHASWDGSGAYDRLIWFTHLPERCEVSIFTLAGDLVDRFEHDSATYQGEGAQLIEEMKDQLAGDIGGGTEFVFSGGEHAWNLVSQHNQAIATGLYLFTVEDHATKKVEVGKFAVIK
jgi:hypothetical protein